MPGYVSVMISYSSYLSFETLFIFNDAMCIVVGCISLVKA